MSQTIAETLKKATDYLREASVPNDLLDAQTLLAQALGRDRTYLIVNYNRELTEDELAAFIKLVNRRGKGEPLQYITGHQEFFGLEFEVTPDVLIPRPETEMLIEETIRLVERESIDEPVIIDVGTGSGCIAVTLAREIEGSRVYASDVSKAAIDVARRNAKRHNLDARINFIVADLLEAFADRPFADFIISNPPYVSLGEMPALQREVRDWEPRAALTDFGDGLNFYRRLLNDAQHRLNTAGYLICEMGYKQSQTVAGMVDRDKWNEPRFIDDLQGIPRTLVLQRH